MHTVRILLRVSLVILCALLILSLYFRSFSVAGEKLLQVSFLDVGQGDATFIESPTGTQVLIDGGNGTSVLRSLDAVMDFGDRDIDMVIATHPDMDHIGGLIGVLERYTVHTILMTENMSDTPAFETFVQRVKEEGAEVRYARRGQVYDLGSGTQGSTTLTILFPDHDPSNLESNTSSIVAHLVYGESEYLFTGDSPQEIEEYLVSLDSTTVLASDVLKAGHHGSRTSSSPLFVRALHPQYAIFSSGKNNTYGHPHREVVDLFTSLGIIQKNTADEGSIFSESDGVQMWFK